MQSINATNCFDGWQKACRVILQQGAIDNLNIEFLNPSDFTHLNAWLSLRNPKTLGGDNIRHVINTIFPYTLYGLINSRNGLYNKYQSIFSHGTNRSWGTYFQRLISFDRHFNNNGVNQLENAIISLSGNSPQRNYIVFHLSAVNLDSNVRVMGAPCWQFGQITKNANGSINLIAVYRNHDYFNKALGNFIGLAKLLEFIATESHRTVGKLIIHSIHAFNNNSSNDLTLLST